MGYPGRAGSEGWGEVEKELDPNPKRPWQTLVAEGFLILVICIYFAKICILAVGMQIESGESPWSWNFVVFLVEIFMLFVTADAMLGLVSRRPKGWKKAVRGSMLLLLFTLIGWYSSGAISVATLVTLNPLIVTPLVLVVFVLMLMPDVRDYYVPPMESRRPLSAWIKFAFFSELYPTGKYRISYPEDDPRSSERSLLP